MPRHVRNKRVFRREPEPELFPSSLESQVGEFVVRLRQIVEVVAGPRLRSLYKPQGGIPYDPVGLFCVLVFGLMRRTSSSRELEDRVRYDLRFQFLMHSQTPDHTTISRFRNLLGEALEEISLAVLAKAKADGLISARNVAIDGTKIEANTSQWKRMVKDANEEDAHADPDARLMKHRRTGTLRGFNAQIAVDMDGEGFILANHVSNKAKDSEEMETHLQNLPETPEKVVADAGYDSAPNHQALADEGVMGFVSPHGDYDEFWDIQDGQLRCPAGHIPVLTSQHPIKGVLYDNYSVTSCRSCPLKTACNIQTRKTISARAGFDPAVRVANSHRTTTEEGRNLRIKRGPTVERVFGHLKANRGLTRFKRRGLASVTSEFRLICLSYNLEKLLRALQTLLFTLFRLAQGRKLTVTTLM